MHSSSVQAPAAGEERHGTARDSWITEWGLPNRADVITLGDSQTYGMGVSLANNWRSQLAGHFRKRAWTVYCMAVGGRGAVRHLDLFSKAARLDPRLVIVAFYGGNGRLESFFPAYGNGHWAWLRPEADLDKSDVPEAGFLLAVEDAWPVKFRDGVEVFTPKGRLTANDTECPAVRAGYAIMADVADRITASPGQKDIGVLFMVIATRELVYEQKAARERVVAPDLYRQVVMMEQANVTALGNAIQATPGARYVDLVQSSQAAALSGTPLYPRKWDGHPGQAGYRIIAEALAVSVDEYLAENWRKPVSASTRD